MSETIFFEQEGIKVTNARFIVHGQTYAMNGVTSVKSHVIPAEVGKLWVGVAAGLLLMFALEGGAKIIGLVLAGVCGWLLSQAKDTHAVLLSSASGEVQALSRTDPAFIGGVVNALNEAVIHRG